ncbi:hypothetical protein GGR54DRAFT_641256 [Hypoxylon sp. NC1633]|nr:hypothetical protein GGR54DRAFT_641256 [Hypoxylon sp. NC1633]
MAANVNANPHPGGPRRQRLDNRRRNLRIMMPEDGFTWTSHKATRPTALQCDRVRQALVKNLPANPAIWAPIVDAKLAELFDKAATRATDGGIVGPVQFWTEVAAQVPWANDVDGNSLYQLSIWAIACRKTSHTVTSQSSRAVRAFQRAFVVGFCGNVSAMRVPIRINYIGYARAMEGIEDPPVVEETEAYHMPDDDSY